LKGLINASLQPGQGRTKASSNKTNQSITTHPGVGNKKGTSNFFAGYKIL